MKPTEKELQKAILDYLTIRGWLAWRNNSGMIQTTNSKGSQYRIQLGKSGSPDIIGITNKGIFFGVEVKNDKGKQRDSQVEFQRECEARGAIYLLVHSWEEFIAGMKGLEL